MKRINNKYGPDIDVGLLATRRPRDGTEGLPRDETLGNPRNGTQGKPRDGTSRRPRDRTLRMPRDGTERKPRDGTEGMPRDGTRWKPRDGTVRRSRDGTQGMPRDGTKRKPRDEIMLWKELPDAWNVMRLTRHTELIQNQGKRSSRWRKSSKCKPAFEAGNGEGTLFLEREREEYVTVNS